MKLWKFVLLLVLLGGGAVIVAQEVRYRDQVREAREHADSLDQLVEVLDGTLEQLEAADASLAAARASRDSSEAVASVTIRDLEASLRDRRAQTDTLEARVRDLVAEEDRPVFDSLTASRAAEVDDLEAQLDVVTGELEEEHALRVQVDSTLAAARESLEACQCALEQAGITVDAFEEVTDGRGWASRAWDSVTSPRAIVTIGVVGLAAYGTWQLLNDDAAPAEKHRAEYGLAVDVPVPWR